MSRPPTPTTPLGRALRRARLAHGLSQGALGAAIGRDRHRIARLEAGSPPTARELSGLCQALAIHPDTLHGAALSLELDALLTQARRVEAIRDAILRAPPPESPAQAPPSGTTPHQLALDLE